MKNKVFVKNATHLIGSLWQGNSSATLNFQYNPDWLSFSQSYPLSLSLRLQDKPHSGPCVANFFDNLLPDSLDVRRKIQSHCHIPSSSIGDLLCSIGQDCVGSLYFQKDSELPSSPSTPLFSPISNTEIGSLIGSLKMNPLGLSKQYEDFRISLAGMQEKTALYWDPVGKQWAIPLKNTPSTHIFKPPIGNLSDFSMDFDTSCENEWLCAQIASAFGLEVAQSELLSFAGQKVLVVSRFDRLHEAGQAYAHRIPQEDLCQALSLPSALKYQFDGGAGVAEIMDLLLGSQEPHTQREHFFKTQILFWLLAAIDGHAKNFSLFLRPQNAFQLTPLYDIISAYPLMSRGTLPQHNVKMAMALRGESFQYQWINLTSRYILSTAKFVKFPPLRAFEILETLCKDVSRVIEEISQRLPTDFPQSVSEPIFTGLEKTSKMLLITLPAQGNSL